MSVDLKDSIAAIQDIRFEASVSDEMDQSERYHAEIMKTHVYEKLEEELRKAIKERKNHIYFFFWNVYGHGKPAPHLDSLVLSETENALNDLPWIARAKFSIRDTNELTLSVHIQNPETKTRLFHTKDRFGGDPIEYYEGERPKEIEQAPAPQALPPPKLSLMDRALIALGIKKQSAPLAVAPPPEDTPPQEPEKTPNQKLSEEFAKKAGTIKEYAALIPGLNVDLSPLEKTIAKIDALLDTPWEEDVIGASRSSFRSALHDIKILGDSFKEHAQIINILNQDEQGQDNLQTLPAETLSRLRQNFENVGKSVENAARRAINARFERAEIGLDVHDSRLRLEKFREVELLPVHSAKIDLER